jgi:hypothetical protein
MGVPKINEPGSGHKGPPASTNWSYLPYSNKAHLATLKAAIKIIDNRIKLHGPCDAAFKSLPGGRTFNQVWSDASVWINYDPSGTKGKYGATRRGTKNITISAFALRMGKWTVAATLVHELAHVNGAGGADTKAEDTLRSCLLGLLHDPTIIGDLMTARGSDERLA